MSKFQALGSLLFGMFLYSFPWIVCAAEPDKAETVYFLGNKQLSDAELRKLAGVEPDQRLDAKAVSAICVAVVGKYNDLNRPFARCKAIRGEKGVAFQITEGPQIRYRDITFAGNNFVNSVVLRDRIRDGKATAKPYDLRNADADSARVEDYYRGFGFRDVRVAREIVFENDGASARIVFHVIEGPRYAGIGSGDR